jgi:hypothetical protein
MCFIIVSPASPSVNSAQPQPANSVPQNASSSIREVREIRCKNLPQSVSQGGVRTVKFAEYAGQGLAQILAPPSGSVHFAWSAVISVEKIYFAFPPKRGNMGLCAALARLFFDIAQRKEAGQTGAKEEGKSRILFALLSCSLQRSRTVGKILTSPFPQFAPVQVFWSQLASQAAPAAQKGASMRQPRRFSPPKVAGNCRR